MNDALEPSQTSPGWLGVVPVIRAERHYGDRVMRCFVVRPKSMHALLAAAVATDPGTEAIVCQEERLSYQGFDAIVNRWAGALAELGVKRGERVALVLGNGIAFPAVLFAVLRLGAIAVPISTREQAAPLAYMLGHCCAKVLVHDVELSERLPVPSATPQLQHRIALAPDMVCSSLPPDVSGAAVSKPTAFADENKVIIHQALGTTVRTKGAMLLHLTSGESVMHYRCCMSLS